jgi:hypothetical protein
MAALLTYVNLASTALTAGAPKTVLALKMPANQRGKIYGYGFFYDGTVNSAQPVQVTINRTPTGGTTGNTNVTVAANEKELTEVIQTSQLQYTAEPTWGATLKTFTVHPQLGYEWLAPLGQEVIIAGNDTLGFTVNAPAAVDVRGYVLMEE